MTQLLAVVLLAAGAAEDASAKSSYLAAFRSEYPAAVGTRLDDCDLCHTSVPQLNSYGSAFSDASRQFASIEALDSDGDGALNLTEIEAFTFPGDPTDLPAPPSLTPTVTRPPSTPTATPSPTATRTPGAGACVGDCGNDGAVTVDELVRAVTIDLGLADVDACRSIDVDGDGGVSIDEELSAVDTALQGCFASQM